MHLKYGLKNLFIQTFLLIGLCTLPINFSYSSIGIENNFSSNKKPVSIELDLLNPPTSSNNILVDTSPTPPERLYDYLVFVADMIKYPGFPDDPNEPFKKSVEAYFWGLPLVEMKRTQRLMTEMGLELNNIYDNNQRDVGSSVVSPNLDVLYSEGFVNFSEISDDTTKQAFILHIPKTNDNKTEDYIGTYNVIQLIDAYTNVVASFGTRHEDYHSIKSSCKYIDKENGINDGGDIFIRGPKSNITIETLKELKEKKDLHFIIECTIPTDQVWLIGRMAVDAYAGAEKKQATNNTNTDTYPPDIKLSNYMSSKYLYEYTLTPLPYYLDNSQPQTPLYNPLEKTAEWIKNCSSGCKLQNPFLRTYLEVQKNNNTNKWTPSDFLNYLGDSVYQNGLTEGNKLIYKSFKEIGLDAHYPGWAQPANDNDVVLIYDGILRGADFLEHITDYLDSYSNPNEPWKINTSLGFYDPDSSGWTKAAIIAAIGLGANLADDGIYPLTTTDSAGEQLNGTNNYTLTFDSSTIPPVSSKDGEDLGFWSITVYNTDGTIYQDEMNNQNPFYQSPVYSLGSMQFNNIPLNSSGPLTIYLQNSTPHSDELPFWVPTPTGDFEVLMRIYYPDMKDFPTPYNSIRPNANGNNNKYIPPPLIKTD